MNIPEYYEDVSLRLTEVLDASGLKDDLRWRRINTWLQTEELERILTQRLAGIDFRLYYFGSQAEATTTPGLSSDIDKIICIHDLAVLQNLQLWVPSFDMKRTFLMVADESTPPGYVKLQLLQEDAPILVHNYQDDDILLDTECRSVLYNGIFHATLENLFGSFDRHGPASTVRALGISSDIVFAIPCGWPDQISRRMSTSRRHYNWPTRKMMDVIKHTEVLLVPVGHKLSHEQHLEWRLSFSFAEKLLMLQFNSTQYKCYVMLKFLKNTYINVDTVEDVLTSYHCKTCMFYVIEDTPASLWQPHNLMHCIDLCLIQILSWVQCAKCPNYFIPDENMFLGKLVGPVKHKLVNILQHLLCQNGRYISKIPYENIGVNVVRVYSSLRMELVCPDKLIIADTFIHLVNILNQFCMLSVNCNTYELSFLNSRYGQRQEISNVVRTLFCSALGIQLASQYLKQKMSDPEILMVAEELLLLGSSFDVASGKLKLAAFYLAQGKLDTVEEVLSQVDANLTHNVHEDGDMIINSRPLSKILNEDLSISTFIQNYCAFMVFYKPSDIHGIPKGLIFEIFHSTESELCLDITAPYLLPIVAVKARVYLYFLQYQCFRLQGREAQRSLALNNMIWVSQDHFQKYLFTLVMSIISGRYVSHINISGWLRCVISSLNLMAYCLKQDGRQMDAFKVLCASMMLQNEHNAAKWQIATFLNSAIRILRARKL